MKKQHGHTHKHTQGHKHHHPVKHHPVHPPAPPQHPGPGQLISVHSHAPRPHKARKRQLSPNHEFGCCVAEAVAASLLLSTGYRATEDQILELYFRTADDDSGATISDTLDALMKYGLAGIKPASFSSKIEAGTIIGIRNHAMTLSDKGIFSWGYEIPVRRNFLSQADEACNINW